MLDEHEMFEKFGCVKTSKQGQVVETYLMSGKQCQSVSPGLRAGRGLVEMTECAVQNMEGSRVFSRPFRHGRDLSPPPPQYGRT